MQGISIMKHNIGEISSGKFSELNGLNHEKLFFEYFLKFMKVCKQTYFLDLFFLMTFFFFFFFFLFAFFFFWQSLKMIQSIFLMNTQQTVTPVQIQHVFVVPMLTVWVMMMSLIAISHWRIERNIQMMSRSSRSTPERFTLRISTPERLLLTRGMLERFPLIMRVPERHFIFCYKK